MVKYFGTMLEKRAWLVSSIFFIFGRASVLLDDPNNVCSKTGTSHVLPGIMTTLLCAVNNTGAVNNLLIWSTPVNQNGDLIHISGALSLSNSMFSSIATFNGDLANATLTFTTTQSLDNQVVSCKDNLGYSKKCSLLIYSE